MNTPEYFGTNGIRGIPNKDLTTEFSMAIGKGIATFFNEGKIAIAKDTRISGDMFLLSVSSSVLSTGTDVVYLGILPTPGLQYYCKMHHIPGIMITASHNPPEYNGIKAIDKDGTEINEEDELEIEKIIKGKSFKSANWSDIGTYSSDSTAIDEYINGVMESVDTKSIKERNFNVIIDTGNGAAFYTSPKILSQFNCHIVALNANPDGKFSSRNSEPKPENLKDLISLMKTGKFDVGIAHDGDADRCVFVDEQGNFIDGDKSLALIVKYSIKKGDTVVTPISSSDALKDICKEKEAKLIITRVGAPIVARAMIENKATLGGEENGGIIYGKHQYCRDGAMTMSLMLNLMAKENKKISELIAEVPNYTIIKASVPRIHEWEEIKKALSKANKSKKIDYMDGIKIFEENGWVLIRPSGTEKIIRVYAESAVKEDADHYSRVYIEFLKGL
ncbi:MAG: phosphoglucosamine mutase [Ferroplasma sp.]